MPDVSSIDRQIATVISTVLAAKMLAASVRRDYGYTVRNALATAHTPTQIDAAYIIAFGVCLWVVRQVGVANGLLIAILLQAGLIVGARIVLPGNHIYLELIVAVVCLRLVQQPGVLVAAIQIVTVSVWVYAALQKIYHREFLDGSFFYVLLEKNARLKKKQAWTRILPVIPPIEGFYAPVDQAGQAFARRFAVLVVALEVGVPLIALAASGTAWGFLLLLGLAIPVSLLMGETSFMITNVLLSLAFLVPFDLTNLSAIATDGVVLAVVVWCLTWPPVHAVLTRRYRFSSWKLAGWGMFATLVPRIDIVDRRGALVPPRSAPSTPLSIVAACGACQIRWLREYAARSLFRWYREDQVRGLLLRWYRRRGNRYVTECVWLPNQAGAAPQAFEVGDERGELELRARLLMSAAI